MSGITITYTEVVQTIAVSDTAVTITFAETVANIGGAGSGANLGYTASATNGTVTSDTGTDATLPLGTGTNAGLLAPAQFTKLSNLSGTNTGDQTTIVGITGTKSQFDTAVTDGNFAYQSDLASYQPLDTDLTAIAALTSAADKVPYSTGAGTWALADFTSLARTLAAIAAPSAVRFYKINADNTITLRTAAELLSDIGAQASGSYLTASNIVETITNGVTTNAPSENAVFDALALKQDLDAELTAIAGLTSAADKGIQFTGSGTAATYDLTTAGKALLDDANAAAQLVTLGFTASITELNYTDGVTSAIQTQLDAKVAKATVPCEFIVACSDETTALTTGTAKVTFRAPYAFTVTAVRASVTTAPTGGTLLTVDINESGTTILSTKLTFDASEKTTTTAATAAVISDSAIADDAEITIDVDAVGSTIAGAGLKVYIIGTHAV